jgi:hypothetical protein
MHGLLGGQRRPERARGRNGMASLLLKNGIVVSGDPAIGTHADADLLIDGDTISASARGCRCPTAPEWSTRAA